MFGSMLKRLFLGCLFLSLTTNTAFAGQCQPVGSVEACSVNTDQGKVVIYKSCVLKICQCSCWLELPDGTCDLVANRVDCKLACTPAALQNYKLQRVMNANMD